MDLHAVDFPTLITVRSTTNVLFDAFKKVLSRKMSYKGCKNAYAHYCLNYKLVCLQTNGK